LKTVLLTGGTGTIGSALVPRLLADSDSTLILLVRAHDDAALRNRLAAMLPHWGLASGAQLESRLHLVRGDISLPGFGLQPATMADLARQITHIVHCAASVKLNMPMAQALATAVVPTRTLLALSRLAATAGTLQKVDVVSTVGVWGRSPGCMPERRLPEVMHFHNTYEEAKAEAERVIWADGDGLPITVHRPSMVVGDTQTGRVTNFQVFYHLCEFLSGTRTIGVMPNLGQTRLDTVPVDWVADAIAWSSATPETIGRIFHLCSGPDEAIGLVALQQTVRQTWQAAGRRVPRLLTVDRQWLERLIPVFGLLAGARSRRALRGLSPVLAYLAEDQSFANEQTAQQLAKAGLPVPRVQDYLATVLDYYLQRRAVEAQT